MATVTSRILRRTRGTQYLFILLVFFIFLLLSFFFLNSCTFSSTFCFLLIVNDNDTCYITVRYFMWYDICTCIYSIFQVVFLLSGLYSRDYLHSDGSVSIYARSDVRHIHLVQYGKPTSSFRYPVDQQLQTSYKPPDSHYRVASPTTVCDDYML